MHATTPKISVIVPVDDYRPEFDPFFCQWLNQTATPESFELLVMTFNQQQLNQVNESLERHAHKRSPELNIKVFLLDNIGKSRARAMNFGVQQSRAPLLYLFGDDFIPSPGAVAAHLKFHEEHPDLHEVGVGMAFIPEEFRTPFVVWLEESGSLFGVPFRPGMTEIRADFFYIANTSIKRQFFDEAGCFDETFRFHCSDDWELGQRLKELGLHSRLVPEAEAIHQHRVTMETRLVSIHESGQSSRSFEQHNPEAQRPWAKTAAKSLRWLYAKAWLYEQLYRITNRKHYLHSHFKSRLDAAFVEGYKNEPLHTRLLKAY